MADSQITVKESEGQFFVPIKVDGKANGDVKVTVKVEGTGNNPAQPTENGVVTLFLSLQLLQYLPIRARLRLNLVQLMISI